MMPIRKILGMAFGLGLLAGAAGCGEKTSLASNVPVHPVKGKIVVGGQPLTGAFLNLSLLTNKEKYGEAEAVAEVQPDGTFEPNQVGDKKGLVEGKWKVVVQPNFSKNGKSVHVRIPAKYTRADSDLTFEVTSGDNAPVLTIQ